MSTTQTSTDDKPWRDEQTLRELYVDKNMSTPEMEDELPCTQQTINKWINRYSIKKPWDDEQTLREMYVDDDMSSKEIAEELECSNYTILDRLHDSDIEVKTSRPDRPPHYCVDNRGYEVWRSKVSGTHHVVQVHRLVAVAEYGFDEVVDKHIHHKNEISWDNRHENLEPLTPSEHNKLHSGGDEE